MRLHLGGHLSWYDPQKRAWLDVFLDTPAPLVRVLAELGVPAGEVAIVAVNRRAVNLEDAVVANSDQVELYPPIGGGQLARQAFVPSPGPWYPRCHERPIDHLAAESISHRLPSRLG